MSMLHEFGSGWTQSVELRHRSVAATDTVRFIRESDPTGLSPLVTAELTLQTRYAGTKNSSPGVRTHELGSRWPI